MNDAESTTAAGSPFWKVLDELTGEWNPPPSLRTAEEIRAWVRGVSDVIRLAKSFPSVRLGA